MRSSSVYDLPDSEYAEILIKLRNIMMIIAVLRGNSMYGLYQIGGIAERILNTLPFFLALKDPRHSILVGELPVGAKWHIMQVLKMVLVSAF